MSNHEPIILKEGLPARSCYEDLHVMPMSVSCPRPVAARAGRKGLPTSSVAARCSCSVAIKAGRKGGGRVWPTGHAPDGCGLRDGGHGLLLARREAACWPHMGWPLVARTRGEGQLVTPVSFDRTSMSMHGHALAIRRVVGLRATWNSPS
ncbi:hypothetical protein Dimus_003437 [Dionaea muscipula]